MCTATSAFGLIAAIIEKCDKKVEVRKQNVTSVMMKHFVQDENIKF